MAINDIDYVMNPASMLKAMREILRGEKEMEQGVVGGAERQKAAWESLEKGLLSVNNRQEASNKRLVRSIIERNEAYGKTPIQKLIQEQDQIIKRLGLEGAALDKLTASYKAKIRVMQEEANAAKGGGGVFSSGGSGLLALRGARDLFEGRVAYGEVQIGKSLLGLGGSAAGIGLAAAAIVGVSVAAYKAAESFAHWGVEQSNLQQKLGVSAKELAVFNFAARATGTETESLVRVMRGIAIATEDFSAAGNKARATFASIGFSLQDANGHAKPFAQAIQELSVAVDKIPPGTEKAAFMIETLKRSGIESIPMLHELAAAAKRFDNLHLPFNDQSTIDNAKQMNERLAEMGTKFDHLVLKAKELAALGFFTELNILQTGTISGQRTDLLHRPSGIGDREAAEDAAEAARRAAIPGVGTLAARSALSRYGLTGLEGAQQAESDAKEALNKARTQLQLDAGNNQITLAKVSQDTAAVVATNTEYMKRRDILKALEQADSRRLAAAEELLRIQKESYEIDLKTKFGDSAAGKVIIEKKLSELELADLTKKFPTNAAAYRAEGARRNRDFGLRYTFGFLADQEAASQYRAKLNRYDQAGDFNRNIGLYNIPDLDEYKKQFDVEDRISTINLEGRRSELERQAGKATRLSELTSGGDETGAITRGYEIRVSLARELAKIEQERIDAEDDIFKKQEMYATKQKDLYAQLAQAADDAALKQTELLHKQFDTVKKDAEGLLTTLFTHPSKFGGQLGSTLKSAALHPVVEGLSGLVSRSLTPLIYGADGKSGLANAMKIDMGPLGSVKVDDGAIHVLVDNISRSAGDYSGGHYLPSGPGALVGAGGFGSILTAAASVSPMLRMLFQAPTSGSAISSHISYAGGDQGVDLGTSVTAGAVPTSTSPLGSLLDFPIGGGGGGGFGGGGGYTPGGSTGSSVGLLRSILSGGRTGGGFKLPSLAALKSSFWNENINTGSGSAVAASSLGLGGKFAGVLTSPGAGALETSIGLPLAMAGISGVNRGTTKGWAESAAGGALTGAGIGTMILPGIGTAIGAAAGFAAGSLISLGETLAGVKSDRQKAIEDVRQVYHIGISTAMADKIAGIAQSKYGDNVAVAVRSPEVRQMLGLYAAGRGEASSFPQSANTPMGGSLVNQGGTLYQAPVYSYGNPYTYSSNLPVAGGVASGSLPSPGGSVSMSFNMGGKSVSDFMNGEVFTPEATAANVQSAYNSSYGRTQASMTIQDPTGIVG